MPYIDKDKRAFLNHANLLNNLSNVSVDDELNKLDEGELNYLLTRILLKWLGTNYSYKKFLTAVGTLHMVSHELYRKLVAHYEDRKEQENGPVFPPWPI